MNDAEAALIAIANPITWVSHLYQVPHSIHPVGRWEGRASRASYQIILQVYFHHVDVPPLQHTYRLRIRMRGDGTEVVFHVNSIEQAKELCMRHALSGDLQEIEAVNAPLQTRERAFTIAESSAYSSLKIACESHQPRWLTWYPDTSDALDFSCTTASGTYAVHFDPDRRWIVSYAHPDGSTDERRFLQGAVAKMACSLHACSGNWYATLTDTWTA